MTVDPLVQHTYGALLTQPLPLRRPRYAAHGQALIMAVLIMFLLIGLGGLFIAILNHAMVQTARIADRLRLEEIALAGLTQAQNQLRTSTDGADWQPGVGPDSANPGWIHLGQGFYKITVHYGPSTLTAPLSGAALSDVTQTFFANPLDHMLRIDVEASYALSNQPSISTNRAAPNYNPEATYYFNGYQNGQRFLHRTLTSLQPIGLTDYAFWATNYDNSPTPIVLGSSLSLSDLGITGQTGDYYSLIDGPLRCEGDAKIGNLAIFLTNNNSPASTDAATYATGFNIARYDQLTVVGNITPLINNPTYGILFNHITGSMTAPTYSSANTITPPNAAANYIQNVANNPLLRPLQAPPIDARDRVSGIDRYRALTRDSGYWNGTAFSGLTGDGAGLYINNTNDIQYNGNQTQLMAEWLDPTSPHWANGVYQPQMTDSSTTKIGDTSARATEVVLHDWGIPDTTTGERALPYIELRRYDNVPFVDSNNAPLSNNQLNGYYYKLVPYPRNGVVFAEGNLVVKSATPDGVKETSAGLPASLAYGYDAGTQKSTAELLDGAGAQEPGGWNAANNTIQYYVNDANRRFDLTVVSGGTIYIEGNLLGPASRQASYLNNGVVTAIQSGSNWDSKLALMAMDNVVLNPTTLTQVISSPPEDLGTEKAWRVTHDKTVTVQFTTAGSPATAGFVIRDAGDANAVLPGDPAYTIMQMAINGVMYPWAPGAGSPNLYYFCSSTVRTDYFTDILPIQWSQNMYPGPFGIHTVNAATANLQGYGALNSVQFSLDAASKAHYLLDAGSGTLGPGFVLTGINLQVDALVYAQRGSWFVIPGAYQNNDPTTPSPYPAPYPQYREPFDLRIMVNGAVVENRPAPLSAEEQSLLHWRGPNSSYATGTTGLDPANGGWDSTLWQWTNRRAGIEYHYDATLARPVCYSMTADGKTIEYFPRLPKLPVSPSALSFGQMSGV